MSEHQINRNWRIDLIERHPHLFQTETGTPGYPAVGDGWRDLVETAVGRIADAVAAAPSGSLAIVQIKEKFATLRIYTSSCTALPDGIRAKVEEAIALAEARSACTCETCGAEGRLFKRGGVYLTACDEHGKGEPVPVRPGRENLHFFWVVRDG